MVWIHLGAPDTQKALSGRNFVSERLANLGRGKGDAAVVELKQAAKVGEVTLSGLRTQVADGCRALSAEELMR